MPEFVKRTRMDASPEALFRWHLRPGAFERLTPPWERVRVLSREGGVEEGGRITLQARIGPFRRRWVARHHGVVAGREFRDTQERGPFPRWEHLHRFEAEGTGSILEDRIEYALPLGLGGAYVRRRLERLFEYRHMVTSLDVSVHAACRTQPIWVTGGSGFLGSGLVPFLSAGGHPVTVIHRNDPTPSSPSEPYAVVHLAGENIAGGRWTNERKQRILDSRVEGTRKLVEALLRLTHPPETLVCASAVGYYGSRGNDVLTEASAPGGGFLADVCRQWEAAAKPAADAGIRLVLLRFGMILSPEGGALRKMLTPFKVGLGGPIGNGMQVVSWITRDDAAGAIHHAIATPSLRGPVNAVAPNPVTNLMFTEALARALHRPSFFPMPAFAARVAFGEMADELLLSSQRVVPKALLDSGYHFRHPTIESAFTAMIR